MTQQPQPAAIMSIMQVPHAWIILAIIMSPLVQVIVTPISVISHLQVAIIILQQHTGIPFIIMQQLHIAPSIMAHIPCII